MAPAQTMQTRAQVTAVEFGLFSPDEISRLAVCRITEPTMYVQNLPASWGPVDHRLGTVDRRLACGTCKRSVHDCPGHFGVIQLGHPVYHVGYIDLVLKILKCVCYYCSALLVTEAGVEQLRRVAARDRKKRLSLAMALAKTRRTCPSCGGCNPTYAKHGLTIRTDFSKVKFEDPAEAAYCARPFSSSDARIILQCLTDADATLLGLNPTSTRPELFLISSLAVCPPIVRPSVVISEGSKARGQDDLTSKLCDIVKASTALKAVLAREANAIPTVGLSVAAQQAVTDVTFHVATLMCNEIRGERHSYQRSGLPSKSITSRLKGKEGRIRGSLMGKRVDFSARSVISPDPEMDVDQVGVPERVAIVLTVPERVTDRNIDSLRARVRIGPGRLTGAHGVQRNGSTVLLEYADLEREVTSLKVGEVVERPLQDGDVVLFNRQPSLHKGSFMAFRVKVMPQSTLRINLACTPVLNADCDGDEMNIHVLQDTEAQTEARVIMAVPHQIVSPQSNKPCMGLVQDALLGASLLSREATRISRRHMVELRSLLRYPRQKLGTPGASDGYTGRQAFSMLLPPDLDYVNNKATPPVVVRTGQLLTASCTGSGSSTVRRSVRSSSRTRSAS
jgi:DNA-directed RNA polymerase II subunit RPB1